LGGLTPNSPALLNLLYCKLSSLQLDDTSAGNPPDIVFVIDVSGSTIDSFQGLPVGDVNNDGAANTILDAELAAFIALNNRLVSQGLLTARVSIVTFESGAYQLDMNPSLSGTQLTTNPNSDTNANGIRDIDEILRSLGSLGGTNFEAALQKAQNTLTSIDTTTGNGNLIFISDGQNNQGGSYSDEVLALQNADVKLSAFGVGSGASLSNLQVIDPNASIFISTDQLLAVFDIDSLGSGTQSFREPALEGVTIYLDLNNNGIFDSNEPFQTTAVDDPVTTTIDETGTYTFSNLQPGTYTVREVVPSGYIQTYPNSTAYHTITVGPNQNITNINFGNAPPSQITLTLNPTSVIEDGTTNLVYTFTRKGSLISDLTVNFSVNGTATFNSDYSQTGAATFTATTGTITFAAGLSTATLTINPTADTIGETDETVSLTLATGTGYTIGTTNSITGTITNDDYNGSPTDLNLSNNAIAENQPIGTTIGTLTTTDLDTGNTFTYSLVTGAGDTDNALFTITGNQLQSNGIFDFESKNSCSIRVRTTDQGGLSFEKQLTIGVTDLNEIIGNPSINNGRNPIVGTAGPDYLTGGAGAKTLTGGGGNDAFVFTNMRDVGQRIADFTVGEDKLVFAQLFSSLGYTGSDPIADGYIKFVQGTGSNSAHTFLQIDRDGLTGSAIARNFLQVDNIGTGSV
jgi:hypothetical protein